MTWEFQREGVSRSYLTRLVRLSYLAPDIAQAILDGRQPGNLAVNLDTRVVTVEDKPVHLTGKDIR